MAKEITVLYFASIREFAGAAEVRLTIPAEVQTVADLSRWLEQTEQGLTGRLASVRFAVNEAFASLDQPLADGDVVAVIPPVSGG